VKVPPELYRSISDAFDEIKPDLLLNDEGKLLMLEVTVDEFSFEDELKVECWNVKKENKVIIIINKERMIATDLVFTSINYVIHNIKLFSRKLGAIQGSFANCNISVDLDLFNGGIIEYI